MKEHMDKARGQLGELGALAGKTEAAERKILAQAEKRLAEVQAAIERAGAGVEGAPEAAQDRYLALVTERGQLNTVIARARQALAE
ncbi:hypothetical protein D3C76_1010300 [compost metagenome]